MSRLTIIKNVFANLCRGGVTAFVSLLLPPFLTRSLSRDSYGTWLLILQLSTYVSFLEFGIQTAVGRYVAYCNELGDTKQRDSIVSTSLSILTASGIVAMGAITSLAWQLPNMFENMPYELRQDAQLSLFCVGGSLAVSLPFTVFGGIFIGLQRYDIPAIIISSSKITGAIFVIFVASSTSSIMWMAVVTAIFNIITSCLMLVAYKLFPISITISRKLINKESAKELLDYCFSLFIWSIGMLLITGLDTSIVAYFDYNSLSYYATASSLVVFIAGIQSSAFSTLMPIAAKNASKDPKILGKLLISSTRISVITSLTIGLLLFTFGEKILSFWIGTEYAINSIPILKLLIVANVIRASLIPYSVLLIGSGEQRIVKKSPLIEGIVNLSVSIYATYVIGAAGAAIGTIVGSVVLWFMCVFHNMPRTTKIYFDQNKFAKQALFLPILSITLPTIIHIICNNYLMNTNLTIISMLLFPVSIFKIGISTSEQKNIFSLAKKVIKNCV